MSYLSERNIMTDPMIPEVNQYLPNLNRKTVLVLGGSRGIGSEVAGIAFDQGAHVISASRGQEGPRGSHLHLSADLSTPYGIDSVWGRVGMVDMVFNNVGMYERGHIQDTTLTRWRDVIETNLTSMFLLNRHALNKLQTDGVIINMASRPTLDKYKSWSTYTLSKQGVITLTQAAAEEAERGIHAYAICPSRVDTQFREEFFPGEPKNQRLTAKDTAMAILFMMNRTLPNGSYYWIKQKYE